MLGMESSALVYILLTLVTIGFALCIDNREHVELHIDLYEHSKRYRGLTRGEARNFVAQAAVYLLLAGVSACRIAVGNDYWVYRDNFNLIAQSRRVSSEFGFNYIVKWIQQLFGYDKYLPVFAFFSIITVFFFVKALRDQGDYFAFSLFLLLTNGYYFNSLNSVRYYLALAIALFSVKYVLRSEYIKFLAFILFGAIFHKTILLVIPVYLLAWYLACHEIKKWHIAVGGVFLLSLIFGQDLYRTIIFKIYPYYENSAFDKGQLSYVNIAKCLCVLILCIICYKRSIKLRFRNNFYFYLSIAGLVVYCCGTFIPEVSRIAYYMVIPQIFLIPGLLADMEDGWFKKLCYMGVIGAFALYFVVLLHGMYDINIRLLPYLNWIFN